MIAKLVRLELLKIFSKWRTYIGFIAVGVLVPLIHAAMYIEGETYIGFITNSLEEIFEFNGELLNGYVVARIILQTLYVNIPLLITLVAGDLLAGEATSGTYRLLLVRPASRTQIAVAKYIAGLIYVFLLVAWLAVLTLGIGLLIHGTGDMLVVGQKITILPEVDVPWRFWAAFGLAFIAMWTVYTITYMFSAIVENAIGPIFSTMAIIIVFSIIGVLGIGFLEDISPYLFTTHMVSWRLLFELDVDYSLVWESIAVLMAHTLIIATGTVLYFKRKDINT
jgi:ABC-2 type transport system permease protein